MSNFELESHNIKCKHRENSRDYYYKNGKIVYQSQHPELHAKLKKTVLCVPTKLFKLSPSGESCREVYTRHYTYKGNVISRNDLIKKFGKYIDKIVCYPIYTNHRKLVDKFIISAKDTIDEINNEVEDNKLDEIEIDTKLNTIKDLNNISDDIKIDNQFNEIKIEANIKRINKELQNINEKLNNPAIMLNSIKHNKTNSLILLDSMIKLYEIYREELRNTSSSLLKDIESSTNSESLKNNQAKNIEISHDKTIDVIGEIYNLYI
jgi:hypothetical protein